MRLVQRLALTALLVPATLAPGPTHAAPAAFVTGIADQNRMAVTVTNFGFVGNNFVSRAPSMECPKGSSYEHMPNGGLWIGASAVDGAGAFTGVTTGTLDISQGISSSFATEFSPAGESFLLRSLVPSSPYYDPAAVSDLDMMAMFDDLTPKQASGNPEVHRPLGVQVRQECYAWTYVPYADILFLHFVITNVGQDLHDVWVGLCTQLASGTKGAYSTWPPTSGGSPYGSWYSKKWLEYDASLRLIREHRCSGYPIPSGCQLQVTPYWAGVELLTPPDPVKSQSVTLAAWSWSPGNTLRDQDVERYAIMSAGVAQPLTGDSLMPITGDPVELLALGPFPLLASGDSVAVDFALVGGAEIADIRNHAATAQMAYDMGYRDLLPPGTVGDEVAARGALALSPRANPALASEVSVELSLAGDAAATLELLDVAGRVLVTRDLASLGPGSHRVALRLPASARSGVYFLRLQQAGRSATAKFVAIVR